MQTIAQPSNGHNAPMTPLFPEAQCSVNCFLDTDDLGRVQVTGRGTTPAEAVTHLRGTVAVLRGTNTREHRLGRLLACGLSKAIQRQDLALVERLAKAAALVLAGAVERGNREGLYTVRSQRDPLTWYDYEDHRCTCQDFTRHAEAGEPILCKHALAAEMAKKVGE